MASRRKTKTRVPKAFPSVKSCPGRDGGKVGQLGGDSEERTPEDIQDDFDKELMWCIKQLELGLSTQKPDERQAKEAISILKVLRNPKALLVKKRMLMRKTFGDYRKKIQEAEKQMTGRTRNLHITPVDQSAISRSKFFRQSVNKSKLVLSTTADHSNVTDDSMSTDCLDCKTDQNSDVMNGHCCETEIAEQNVLEVTEQSSQSQDNVDCELSVAMEENSPNKDTPSETADRFKFVKSNNSFRFEFPCQQSPAVI